MVSPLTASRNDRCSDVSRSAPRAGALRPPPDGGAAAARPGPSAEDVAEQVPEIVDVETPGETLASGRVRAREGVSGSSEAADLVVLLALLLVTEHVVGG